MDFLALLNGLVSQFAGADAGFVIALAGISTFLPADEKKIVVDALTKLKTDLANGVSPGQALADTWTVFYSEEKGELGKIGQYILGGIMSGLAPNA